MPTLSQALVQAANAGLDRLDAQLLLLHALGTEPAQQAAGRAWLLAHGDDDLPATARAGWNESLRRRAAGEPLAYITGYKEFFSLPLKVDPRVLIPRPDTETLVEWALEVLGDSAKARSGEPVRALDLGMGSGAIALALKKQLPEVMVDAVDASPDALDVATGNAQALGLSVGFARSFWLNDVAGKYHCIVSNPPYIAAADAHLAALAHEPPSALVSGKDGLDDIRQIVQDAAAHLHPGGWLLLEHGYDQGHAVRALLDAAGYRDIAARRDLAGQERCTGGRMVK